MRPKDQIDRLTNEIDESLLHQKDGDQIRGERWVITEAARKDVISPELKDELIDLYECRNKSIHRYIVSDVNYTYAAHLVFRYSDVRDKVNESIQALEREQWNLGIGIVATQAGTSEPNHEAGMKQWVEKMAADKERRPNMDG